MKSISVINSFQNQTAMSDFQDIFNDLQKQVVSSAKELGEEYRDTAIADGKKLLAEMKDDLERWIGLLAGGAIKKNEFEWLVNSNKSLIKMTGLKQAGLAALQVKKFSKLLLATIIDTSLKAVVTSGVK